MTRDSPGGIHPPGRSRSASKSAKLELSPQEPDYLGQVGCDLGPDPRGGRLPVARDIEYADEVTMLKAMEGHVIGKAVYGGRFHAPAQ